MIGPPAAARSFTDRPLAAMGLSVAIALLTVWAAIALSYADQLPGRLLRRHDQRRRPTRRDARGPPGSDAQDSRDRPPADPQPVLSAPD